MTEKLFLILVSIVIALESVAFGWVVNIYLESKNESKVHTEFVGKDKGMTPDEYKEWTNKVMLDVICAKEFENREKALNSMGEQ